MSVVRLNTDHAFAKIKRINDNYDISLNESIEIAKIIYGDLDKGTTGNETLRKVVEIGIKKCMHIKMIQTVVAISPEIEESDGT